MDEIFHNIVVHLQREGRALSSLDHALYLSGNRTWRDSKEHAVPAEARKQLVFTEARSLTFLPKTFYRDGKMNQNARIQALMLTEAGDEYLVFVEYTWEEMLTRLHRGQRWTLDR